MLNKSKTGSESDAVLEDDGTVTPGKKVLIKHMGGNVDKLLPVTNSSISSTFTFTYSGVREGDTLTLFSDGYIADASGNSTKSKIVLEYQANKTGLDNVVRGGWVIVS